MEKFWNTVEQNRAADPYTSRGYLRDGNCERQAQAILAEAVPEATRWMLGKRVLLFDLVTDLAYREDSPIGRKKIPLESVRLKPDVSSADAICCNPRSASTFAWVSPAASGQSPFWPVIQHGCLGQILDALWDTENRNGYSFKAGAICYLLNGELHVYPISFAKLDEASPCRTASCRHELAFAL